MDDPRPWVYTSGRALDKLGRSTQKAAAEELGGGQQVAGVLYVYLPNEIVFVWLVKDHGGQMHYCSHILDG